MGVNATQPFRVAAVQATPVFLDRTATVEKACRLIHDAGGGGAKLAVFPEAFVPAYPFWVWFVPSGDTATLRSLYTELVEHAVTVPGPEIEQLGQAAREAGVHVVIGVNERNAEASGSTLYNTLVYIDANGRLLGKHRKLVPTSGERLVHAQGDGSTLEVYDLPVGRLGGLICWENYMPLAYTRCLRGVPNCTLPPPGIMGSRGCPLCATSRKKGASTSSDAAVSFGRRTFPSDMSLWNGISRGCRNGSTRVRAPLSIPTASSLPGRWKRRRRFSTQRSIRDTTRVRAFSWMSRGTMGGRMSFS